jgi:hypothetical protein
MKIRFSSIQMQEFFMHDLVLFCKHVITMSNIVKTGNNIGKGIALVNMIMAVLQFGASSQQI